MSIIIEPTKIKQSFYLLIPKRIADMVDIDAKTKFSLKIKSESKHRVLEYYFG
jgi:hypothetical protein